MKKSLHVFATSAIALSTFFGISVTSSPVASAATAVSGEVMCVSQAPVVGVWIAASNGGSGWAYWTASGTNYNARYFYSLPKGGSYSVHVGCGGTPSRWGADIRSSYRSGSYNSFVCIDVRRQSHYGECV